jgi:glycosyltransferase involved in cell wall biosynthesis
MPRLILNSIVKNESARIERMLESVVAFIDCVVIVDTGSTDNTQDLIKSFCNKHNLPVHIYEVGFIDFSQARNSALRSARMHAKAADDYILLVDADMELKVEDKTCFDNLTGQSYDMYQVAGTLHYQNRRLVRAGSVGWYRGVTHEYLDVESAGFIPEEKAYFFDHADGANRPNKFTRDISLLKRGLKDEPNNERYFYYLAQSYRDAGKYMEAIRWYDKRVKFGGWPEEQWSAQLHSAECYKALGNEAEFIRRSLIAYNMRPSRAESVYGLANHFRLKGENALACLFAEEAMRIPRTKDALFVNDYAYTVGPLEELSISGFYVESKKEHAFNVTNKLSLTAGPYAGARELARNNMFWYVSKLSEDCPSFKSQKLGFTPEDGWTAMNPSIARLGEAMFCVVRTVNYTMDDEGRYLIKGVEDDGKVGCNANATNPIHTRNWLVRIENDLSAEVRNELLPPGNMPVGWPLVIGFEDMRLFSSDRSMWTSSTVRQIHQDGNCEQVLARIDLNKDGYVVGDDYKRMLRQPRVTEKNWMPIDGSNPIRFMYRLGHVVDSDGKDIVVNKPPVDVGQISGGSQVIPWMGGWLCLVHEARPLPDKHYKRYYWHRFAYLNHEFKLINISHPFVFQEKQIEFAAGLCWHPDGKRFVISYGVQDKEAHIAIVNESEVGKMLWFAPKL